jgi:hypothetical protein
VDLVSKCGRQANRNEGDENTGFTQDYWKKVNLKECDLYNNRAGINLRRSEIERRIRLGKSDRHYPWSVLVISTYSTLDERHH